MAFFYVDFNKATTGDGTWANAFGMVDVYANSLIANCKACNTAATGDELRVVGRDYFTHTWAANTVYVTTSSASAFNIPVGITSNNVIYWAKNVRPESGSGGWWQDSHTTVGTPTLRNWTESMGVQSPMCNMIEAYMSFSNATHMYLNSEVKVIDPSTSTLVPFQHTNDGIYGTTAVNNTMYLFRGMKGSMTITDNWTADGVRDTSTSSNNKTIFFLANTSPGGQNYFTVNFVEPATGINWDNIVVDMPNTVFARMPGANANTAAGNAYGCTMKIGFNAIGRGLTTSTSGARFDIGALVCGNYYPSNIPQFYVYTSTNNWLANSSTVPSIRIRSQQSGYVYYPLGNTSSSISTGSTNVPVEIRLDFNINDSAYVSAAGATISKSTTNSVFRYVIGDYFSLPQGSYSYNAGSAVVYDNKAGWTYQTTATTPQFEVHFDRSRIYTGCASGGASVPMSTFPFGFAINSTYASYALAYKALNFTANGTISLSNNAIYTGSLLGRINASLPGEIGSTAAPSVWQSYSTSTNFAIYTDGKVNYWYRLGYSYFASLKNSFSKLDAMAPVQWSRSMAPVTSHLDWLPNLNGGSPFGVDLGWPGSTRRPITVDRDDNFGGVPVEYIPGGKATNIGGGFAMDCFLPVTACTDVVSAGYSLKFNVSSLCKNGNGNTMFGFAGQNKYSPGTYIKEINIPTLADTAAKTVTMSIKKDTNTSIISVNVYFYTANTFSNTSTANTAMPTMTAGNTIVNTSITTSYTTWNAGTFTPASTTANMLVIELTTANIGTAGNGAIYIDQINIA